METMTNLDAKVEELQRELGGQASTLKDLTDILADEARKLIRRDQIACLNQLKARIMEELEHIQRMETVARTDFNKGKLISSLITFAIGTPIAAARGEKDPVSTGAKLVKSVLDERAPFGTTLVAVGKDGIPSDVGVTPVSHLARQSRISESEVMVRLQSGSYLFMTPEVFVRVLAKIQSRLLDGSVSLPVPFEQVASEMRECA